jgi:hypothetical protein
MFREKASLFLERTRITPPMNLHGELYTKLPLVLGEGIGDSPCYVATNLLTDGLCSSRVKPFVIGTDAANVTPLRSLTIRQFFKDFDRSAAMRDGTFIVAFGKDVGGPTDVVAECKWQQSGGSVDEKYPLLVFNILKTGIPTIVLLDGGGYSAEARAWLLEQVHDKGALIGVWDMSEFQRRANNGYFG